MKLYLASLGCAKNLVDSEVMLGRLINAGWHIIHEPEDADIILINTCSFIRSAVDESIDTILELAKYKKKGTCRRLIVAGCLPQRFGKKITDALPEVDFFLGTGAFDKILNAVENTADTAPNCFLPDPNRISFQDDIAKKAQSLPHTAYIKVAEGCSRHCTYCIIPKLRGRHRSRPLESIVSEAKSMVASGVKELVFIAQDTTCYGSDLNPKIDLAELLEEISKISDTVWIRFLYGHPDSLTENTIKTVVQCRNICSYFDIPIQHGSNAILKKMGRDHTSDDLYRLFDRIRHLDPDACLRTTVITGFPGETDKDFKNLLTFIEDIGFNHLGVFTYSDSEDIPSHHLPGHIPGKVAQERFETLMACQADISLDKNRSQIGKIARVLVEKGPEEEYFVGRTMSQAPEVDGTTFIKSGQLQLGNFVDVKITEASDYDLIGEIE